MAANEKTNTEVMKEKFEGRELTPEQLEDVAGGGHLRNTTNLYR